MIAANIGAIELTQGCSIGCYFCGFEAKRGVTGVVAFSALERFLKEYGHLFREGERINHHLPMLYYATDPLDYQDPKTGHNYRDVLKLFRETTGKCPPTITAVPKGKEELWMELLADEEIVLRTSLSVMNRGRLKSYLRKKFKADDVDIYVFEGANVYSPCGEENSGFKYLELKVNDFNGSKFTLFRVDCRNVDDSILYLGKNKKKLSPRGIGCFNGVLMRPAVIQNTAPIRTSQKHPAGLYFSEISKDPKFFKVFRLADGRVNSHRYISTTPTGRISIHLFNYPIHYVREPVDLIRLDYNFDSIPIEIDLEKILAANGADTSSFRKKLNRKIVDWFGDYYVWSVPDLDTNFNLMPENPSDNDLKITEYIKCQTEEDRNLFRNSIKKHRENAEKRKKEYQANAASGINT